MEEAANLVENTIKNPEFFWKPYGISACNLEVGKESHHRRGNPYDLEHNDRRGPFEVWLQGRRC